MKLSRVLLVLLNAVTGLIGLALVAGGIYFAVKNGRTECDKALQWPAIAAGAFIFLVSSLGFYGVSARSRGALQTYMVIVSVLIAAVVAFTVVAIVLTHRGTGRAVSGVEFKEYHLGDYSTWLQRKISKASNWRKIKSCLIEANVCKSVASKQNPTLAALGDISAIQSGCCKPPVACNLTYGGGTSWNRSGSSNITSDTDCSRWNNDASQLCFDCNSCKAGVLQKIKDDWRYIAIFDAAVLVILIVALSLACCARRHRYPAHRPPYPAHPPHGAILKA